MAWIFGVKKNVLNAYSKLWFIYIYLENEKMYEPTKYGLMSRKRSLIAFHSNIVIMKCLFISPLNLNTLNGWQMIIWTSVELIFVITLSHVSFLASRNYDISISLTLLYVKKFLLILETSLACTFLLLVILISKIKSLAISSGFHILLRYECLFLASQTSAQRTIGSM